MPLSAFYVFSFFTILLRLIFIIIIWSSFKIFAAYINDCYLTTKLGVGLIQSWMVLEIALRERRTYKLTPAESAASAESFEKRLLYG